MKFTVERNWIDVIGQIWMPAVTCATRRDLSDYDMRNIGEPTRENVDRWLALNVGDFQSIADFHAVIGETEIPWEREESELTFIDCMYPAEE